MGLFIAIASAVAVGTAVGIVVAYIAIKLTKKWLIDRAQKKLDEKKAEKVAVTTIEKLIDECPNEVSLKDLKNKGNTHVVASVDSSGKVVDVDVIKDQSSGDREVDDLLGSQRMVVIKN